jgi:3'(2'), 5'-bisphosphate nucleotidase
MHSGLEPMANLNGVRSTRGIRAGGQYEWDSAAPVAVALAAGFHVSRLDGAPMAYNQKDTYLPDLVVCRPELKDRLMAAVG